ncbi:MAG: EI24 domain-containing protein [Bacteroidales bacterium]|nr:EI24 domain-containing protein [Bacteroidales bacterium]
MTGLKQFSLGIKTWSEATRFIFKNKLGWTFLVPIAMTIILFIIGHAAINGLIDNLKELILGWLNVDAGGFLSGLIGFALKVAFHLLSFFIYIYVIGFLVIVLMSPLLSFLSEKTEKIITGNEYKTSFAETLKDITRGIGLAFRNLVLELLSLFLLFIPVIGWLAVFIISAYFYGFSFIDLNNERQRLNIRESTAVVRKFKWLAIGNGIIFSLALIIPFFKFFIPFFASIIAVVAATIAMHKTDAYKGIKDSKVVMKPTV